MSDTSSKEAKTDRKRKHASTEHDDVQNNSKKSKLSSTCSKLRTILSSQIIPFTKRIVSAVVGLTEEDVARDFLKDAARIEAAFEYHSVRVIEVSNPIVFNGTIGVRRHSASCILTFPWDSNKIICPTHGNKKIKLINAVTHTTTTVALNVPVQAVAVSDGKKVALLLIDGQVQLYSIANETELVLVSQFNSHTTEEDAKIAWTGPNSSDLIVFRSGSDKYTIYSESGKIIKATEDQGDDWKLFAVSPDGSHAIRAKFMPGEAGTIYEVDLASGEDRELWTVDQVADRLCNLRYIAGTDWITWQRTGTEHYALFMYDLQRGEKFWTATRFGPVPSYDGTRLLQYEDDQLILEDLYTEEQIQIELEPQSCLSHRWTYPTSENVNNGPPERIITSLFSKREQISSIGIIDPQTGAILGQASMERHYQAVINCWELIYVSPDNRTLVFGGRLKLDNFMIWNFY